MHAALSAVKAASVGSSTGQSSEHTVFVFSLTRQLTQQWGTTDAKNKDPCVENPELKGSPFKAWSRSVFSQACYAYCKEFLPC